MASRKEYEMLFQLNAQLGSNYSGTFSKAQREIVQMQEKVKALSKTQSDIAAYQKQQSAVEATRSKLAVLQQQYDNIQKEMKETEGYSSALENKLLAKQQQIEKTSSSLQQQTDKLNQMDAALRNAGVDTSNLTRESTNLTSRIEDLKAKQEEAAESAEEFGESSTEAFGAIGQAIASAGIAISLKEIFDAYMDCVDIAADFEETMSTVEALSGASAREMGDLTALAKELGATTKFTAKESAEAMTYMGMAGWDATQMMSGMDGVLQLAAASGENLGLVSDIVTDNLTAFGLKASDTARFSDVLAAAATNSNTSVSIMGETFKMSASVAGALGYSIEDVAVAVGLMANSGIKGSIAGTALKNTFNGLLEGVTLSAKAFGEYKYSAVNADGTMKDFSSTIDELRVYFEQMTEAERVNNAMTVAGQRGYNGLLAILNATDADYAALTQNINECTGAAERMAKIKLDNLKGDITLMTSASDALKTSIGEQFNPELRKLYSTGTEVFGLANQFVTENPILIRSITAFVGVMGLATAGITAYTTIAKVAKTLELASMFSAAGPIMLTVGAVAALTAGVVGIVDAYNDAKIAARQYGNEVMDAAEKYKQAMSEADELERNISEWKSLNETIASGAASTDEVTAAKERLKETEQWLIDNYGIYMDSDGTISDEELESLEMRNEELRETARLQAEIALYNAKEKYDTAKDEVGDTQQKRDALSAETAQMAKEQLILQRHLNSWQRTYNSEEYTNASYADQDRMFNDVMNSLNSELAAIGSDYYFNHFAGVETSIMDFSKEIEKNQEKINKYNTELLEYSESAAAYKKATRDIIGLQISDIPTENLQEFAEAARSIGEQAANAELQTAELERYAEQLTEAAHAAGLLPENQKIVFNADGALNVLEEVADGLDELDGKSVEVVAKADTNEALVKINDVTYKVLKYDDTTGIATFSVDGKKAYGEIDLATGELRKFDEDEAEAFLNANTDDFDKNIQNAKTELASLDGKKVTVTTIFKSVYQTVKQALGFDGYATGTENALPGAHWVGEHGPELLWFEGGEKVLDAKSSAALMQTINGASNHYTSQRNNALSTEFSPTSKHYAISIAPQFVVEGGGVEDIGNRLQEFSDILIGNVMDALEEAGIDKKRGAYA